MAMILMKILLAFIFLLSISHRSDGQLDDYCVADEQASEEDLQGAMKWACENGANCSPIQDNQPCFFPNTTKDHASFAFNSYYQNKKHEGGSCYFNSAALLVGEDPSHDSCKFEYQP